LKALKYICSVVFVAVLFQATYLRYSLIEWRPINIDEAFFLQNVYRMADGERPYVDFWESRVPLAHSLLLPAFRFFEEPARAYSALRYTNLVIVVAVSALFFALLLAYFGWLPALFGLALLNSFNYYVWRPDFRLNNLVLLFLLAAVWLLLEGVTKQRRLKLVLSGFFVGCAILTKQSALLLSFGMFAFVFLYHLSHGRGGRSRVALFDLLIFGAASFLSFWLLLGLILGRDILEGFVLMLRTYGLFALHGQFGQYTQRYLTCLRDTIVPNFFQWLVLVSSVMYANYLAFRRRRAYAPLLLLVLLADCSLLYVVLRSFSFEQIESAFFYAFLFGSAMAAAVWWRLNRSGRRVGICVLGLLVILFSQALFWPCWSKRMRFFRMAVAANERVFAPVGATDEAGFFTDARDAREWYLEGYLSEHAAYESIPLEKTMQRVRLVESIIGYDGYSMGFANMELFPRQPFNLWYYVIARAALEYRASSENDGHCEVMRHYNPLACKKGLNYEDKVLIWLKAYEPEVLILEEEWGQDFFERDRLFEYLKDNYRIYLCSECMVLLAVRNDLVHRIPDGAG